MNCPSPSLWFVAPPCRKPSSPCVAEIPRHWRKPHPPHEDDHPVVLTVRRRNARSNRRGECVCTHKHTHAHIRTPRHSCGWSRCLVDLRLCSLGSLCVISISVVFDLANRLTENQEMVHSAIYAKQLKTDQNSLSAYLKHLQKSKHLPNTVCDS